MSETKYTRLFVSAATLLLAGTAFAQVEIQVRPRQLAGWDLRAREGRCNIRVWVDNRAEVRMRGDGIFVRSLEGGRSHDEGSECSQPIPYNSVSGFQVRQTAGRSRVNLSQEPSRMNNYTAMVTIEDQQGGGDNYAFEVTWRSEGGGADAPAAFFDDVRACQDMVRQRFLSQNGRNSYIDFDNFADRQKQTDARNGRGRAQEQESIRGRGTARSRNESRELTYSCIIDTRLGQATSGEYQLTGGGVRSNDRYSLR